MYKDKDLTCYGIIDYLDLAIIFDNWLRSNYQHQEVSAGESDVY
jgi:hypothetical protein